MNEVKMENFKQLLTLWMIMLTKVEGKIDFRFIVDLTNYIVV